MQSRSRSRSGAEPATGAPATEPTAPRPGGDRAVTAAMVALAAAFAGLSLLSFPRSWSGRQYPSSPRENVGYALAGRFAQGEGFRLPLRHYDRLPADIRPALTPRDAASVEGFVVPQDFAGTMLLHGGLMAIWPPLVLVVSPLFAALGGLAVGRLASELSKMAAAPTRGPPQRARAVVSSAGIAGLVMWLTLPPLLVNAGTIVSGDVPGAFLLLLGTLYLVRFWNGGASRDLAIMAAAMGAATIFRYEYVLFVGPVLALLLATGRLRIRDLLIAAALMAPFAAATVVFNVRLYGRALTTGYGIGAGLLAGVGGTDVFLFRAGRAWNHVHFYVLRWPHAMGVSLAGALAALPRRLWRGGARPLLLSLAAGWGLTLLFHVGHDTSGSAVAQMNASLLRYMLPFLGIGVALVAALAARTLAGRPLVLAAALVPLVSVSVYSGIFSPGGIRAVAETQRRSVGLAQRVITATEPDAIIATRLMDKVLFPDRQTLTLTYLIPARPRAPAPRRYAFDVLPSPERFADVAGRTVARDIPLYLLADFAPQRLPRFRAALELKGLRLVGLPEVDPRFWRVALRPRR